MLLVFDMKKISFCFENLGHEEVIELLLKHGANVNHASSSAINDDKTTPLMWAAFSGRKQAVDVLIKNGANVRQYSTVQDTALLWAAVQGTN